MAGLFSKLFASTQEAVVVDLENVEKHRHFLSDNKALWTHLHTLALDYNKTKVPTQTQEYLVQEYGSKIYDVDPAKSSLPHRAKVIDLMYAIPRRLTLADLTQVSDYDINYVYEFVANRLRTEITAIQNDILLSNTEHNGALTAQISNMLKFIARFPNKPPQGVQTETPAVVENFIPLPSYDFVQDENLKENLEALRTKWERLTNNEEESLSVEDRHIVSQISKTYLPDILRLYRKALNTRQEEEALQLTINQVSLLIAQLDYVLDNHTEDVLSQMKAHAEFLTQKQTHINESTTVSNADTEKES